MSAKLILLTSFAGKELDRLKAIYDGLAWIDVATTFEELLTLKTDALTTLLSFGSGVIVPKEFLDKLVKPAYNLHAASPEFPGRDPHHHAIYRQSQQYGATLHIMTGRVDAGPIVDAEFFPITKSNTPSDILAKANEMGMTILERLGAKILDSEPLSPLKGINWGDIKTKRADLVRLGQLSLLMDEDEFLARQKAFSSKSHSNLALQFHNETFRIDHNNPLPATDNQRYKKFTEDAYKNIIDELIQRKYRFATYGQTPKGKHVILRHDVDMSMHRALRMAQIEAEMGAKSTYFINPHCEFYNLFEPDIEKLISDIKALGHELGLHFDADAYPTKNWTNADLSVAISRECEIIKIATGECINTISWHNPDLSNLLDFDADKINGLHNAYGQTLQNDYLYCSDSNGYWRYEAMEEVVCQGHPRLHLLTHPSWWTEHPISPSQRVDRAILGRARKVRKKYDSLLETGNRLNLR